MPQYLEIIVQLDQFSVRNLVTEEIIASHVDFTGQFELSFLLVSKELLVVFLKFFNGSLVLVALFVQIRQILPIFDFVILLLETTQLFLSVFQLLFGILDFVELSRYLKGIVFLLLLFL